jgi:hypothetical protein
VVQDLSDVALPRTGDWWGFPLHALHGQGLYTDLKVSRSRADSETDGKVVAVAIDARVPSSWASDTFLHERGRRKSCKFCAVILRTFDLNQPAPDRFAA